MGFRPYPFPSLGRGLNLRDKWDAVQPDEAIDLMDVEFTERGSVKERWGYDNLGSALTNRIDSLEAFYRTTSANKQIICGCGTRVEALDNAGAVVASDTGYTAGGIFDFARYGTPNAERMYVGNGIDNVRKWDGAAWAACTTAIKAGALAVSGTSNRLVASRFTTTTGGPAGATSSPSHVYFSNPGDPETWDSTNNIQLTPGDGEKIQAVVAHREFIIVFKESKYFVIYGESVGSDGLPFFDTRPVDSGVGLASPRAYAVAPEGVYFVDRRGVFLTNGGDPVLVSEAIEPIFQGGATPYFTSGLLSQANISNCTATFLNDRLFIGFPTTTINDRVLVYDTQNKWWSVWAIPASGLGVFRVSNDPELVWGQASGSNLLLRMNSSYTDDNGSAITSNWRGGFFNLKTTNQKRVAEIKLWGSGIPTVSLSTDFSLSAGTGQPVDLTTGVGGTLFGGAGTFGGAGVFGDGAQGLIPKIAPISNEGTHFSLSFSSTTINKPWAVHQAIHHVAGEHIPSAISNPSS